MKLFTEFKHLMFLSSKVMMMFHGWLSYLLSIFIHIFKYAFHLYLGSPNDSKVVILISILDIFIFFNCYFPCMHLYA